MMLGAMENVKKLRDEGHEGLEACVSLTEELTSRRHQREFSRGELTLGSLAIGAIIASFETVWRFDARMQHKSPFLCLPQSLVQKILTTIENKHHDMKDGFLSYRRWVVMIELLLQTGRVTELNLGSWKTRNANIYEEAALDCCPVLQKLTRIRKMKDLDPKDLSRYYPETYSPKAANPKIANLENLNVLRMRGFTFDLGFLQTVTNGQWKNLRLLECTMSYQDFKNMDESHMEAFGAVKELHINVDYRKSRNLVPKLLELVQLLPGLEVLGCTSMSEINENYQASGWSQFIDEFSRWMPDRVLLIDNLFLDRCLKLESRWPKGLGARTLHIRGFSYDSAAIEKVLQMPVEHLKTLKLECWDVKTNYKLVESFGGRILRLHISVTPTREPLDLQRVLAAAPCLVAFECKISEHGGPLVTSDTTQLKPSHFRSMKRFLIDKESVDGDHNELLNIYEMFLVGSEAWDVLYFLRDFAISRCIEILEAHPYCGLRTRKVLFQLSGWATLERALELAALLVLRSPRLEEVWFLTEKSDVVPILFIQISQCEWFKKLLKVAGVKLRVKDFRLSCDEQIYKYVNLTMDEFEQ